MTVKEYIKSLKEVKTVVLFDSNNFALNEGVLSTKLKSRKFLNMEIKKIFERPNQEVDIYLK